MSEGRAIESESLFVQLVPWFSRLCAHLANVELIRGLTLSHSAGFQRSLVLLVLRTLPDLRLPVDLELQFAYMSSGQTQSSKCDRKD